MLKRGGVVAVFAQGFLILALAFYWFVTGEKPEETFARVMICPILPHHERCKEIRATEARPPADPKQAPSVSVTPREPPPPPTSPANSPPKEVQPLPPPRDAQGPFGRPQVEIKSDRKADQQNDRSGSTINDIIRSQR